MNVVHSKFPSGRNSQLADLIQRHQMHVCNQNYCMRVDPMTEERTCRFGHPKEPCPEAHFVGDQCVYARYMRTTITHISCQCSEPIWISSTTKVQKPPIKLTKSDQVIDTNLEKGYAAGHYIRSQDVSKKDHFKGRVVGAVEAAYDVCGFHKHRNSRRSLT